MISQEATHAPENAAPQSPAGMEEEATPFLTSPFESAPPLLLESIPTPFFDSKPSAPVLEVEPTVLEVTPTVLEVTPTVLEAAPAPARPAAEEPSPKPNPMPAQRVSANAPDPYAVGLRLLRMAPAWLLFATVLGGSLVLVMGWVKSDGEALAVRVPPKQNDSRAVKPSPKPDVPAPQTAAANAPEVATPPAAPAPAPAAAPAQVAAPAPAPAEQPAPKPADNAGAKFTVQVGSYNSQSEANEHVSRLRAAGFESRSTAVELPGRGTWYRVQVGRFADRAGASQAVTQLRAKGAAANALVAPLQD
jgi:septal ring-binding cell division protein DamX